MSEVVEFYKARKILQQEKKKQNLEYSTEFLTKHKIPFESFNNGIMLRVKVKGEVIEFYPSTGLWMLKSGLRGRGIFNLWKYIRDTPCQTSSTTAQPAEPNSE